MPALGAPALSSSAEKDSVWRKRAGARSPSQRLSPKWHRAWDASKQSVAVAVVADIAAAVASAGVAVVASADAVVLAADVSLL